MSLTAVTVLKSGGVFTPLWVDRLNRQIGEHIKPDRIVCLTDMDVKSCEVIPLKHGWPGWFSKGEAFRPYALSGLCVYLDLDSLLLGNFLELHTLSVVGEGVIMLSDLYTPKIPASGMMIWNADYPNRIYDEFRALQSFPKSWRQGDGAIIGKHCSGRIQDIWPGLVGSYKADKLHDGPRDFKIVAFHGTPKQNDLPPDNWARKEWEKTT